MPLSTTAEHYLEAIYYIAHEGEVPRPGRLAEWLGVSHPTVTVTLRRLEGAGWLRVGGDHTIALTTIGESAATAIVRRHRLLERWLVETLGFDWAAADREAAALAPGASDAVLERLDEVLGQPRSCPHGNPIPGRSEVPPGTVRLDLLAPGRQTKVVRISEVAEHEAPPLLLVLYQLGLIPGRRVAVRSDQAPAEGAIGLEVEGKAVDIDRSVARVVWVA
ncbi:MAG TPA: metal-dependent transcriptional regulator [Acidimicrobiales bacterium]|nr:metal-dependent transcriptional regulator [Acidimicrobiales bacterium]